MCHETRVVICFSEVDFVYLHNEQTRFFKVGLLKSLNKGTNIIGTKLLLNNIIMGPEGCFNLIKYCIMWELILKR